MSKNMKLAINGTVALLLLGALFWFAWGEKTKGVKCRFCGKTFSHKNISFHQLSCDKNDVNMQFDRSR
mgnify:CR=1 FL=1|jgi:hypothetical protein